MVIELTSVLYASGPSSLLSPTYPGAIGSSEYLLPTSSEADTVYSKQIIIGNVAGTDSALTGLQ